MEHVALIASLRIFLYSHEIGKLKLRKKRRVRVLLQPSLIFYLSVIAIWYFK